MPGKLSHNAPESNHAREGQVRFKCAKVGQNRSSKEAWVTRRWGGQAEGQARLARTSSPEQLCLGPARALVSSRTAAGPSPAPLPVRSSPFPVQPGG